MSADNPKCETCRWFGNKFGGPDVNTPLQGRCQCHPPNTAYGLFPSVLATDFCGEHSELEKPYGSLSVAELQAKVVESQARLDAVLRETALSTHSISEDPQFQCPHNWIADRVANVETCSRCGEAKGGVCQHEFIKCGDNFGGYQRSCQKCAVYENSPAHIANPTCSAKSNCQHEWRFHYENPELDADTCTKCGEMRTHFPE